MFDNTTIWFEGYKLVPYFREKSGRGALWSGYNFTNFHTQHFNKGNLKIL